MIEFTSATRQVYAKLEANILSGHLKPRQRLVERVLERELGVSRTPIREALRQLAYAGLVRHEGARGVVVRDVDVVEVFNLFVVRLPLEKLALETITDVTVADEARLASILDALDIAFDANDFPQMVTLNSQFHRAVAELSRNNWLVTTLENVRRQCYLIVQHGPSAERAGLATSLADHRRMYELIVARDTVALVALTFQHMLRTTMYFMRRSALLDPSAELRQDALQAMADQLQRVPPLVLPSIGASSAPFDMRRTPKASPDVAAGERPTRMQSPKP